MKQYARVFRYLLAYKGKIILYFFFIFLSIVFSIVSIGMVMPFLQLIFIGESPVIKATSNNPLIQYLNDFLFNSVRDHGKIYTMGLICLLIVGFVRLKNLFLYLSYSILIP